MGHAGFTHESQYNESKEWYTPRGVFDALGIEFDIDPCSPGKDVVPWIPAHTHYTIREDGFTSNWLGNVFMNPPYGQDTPKWMRRLVNHGEGIALVFARTDTGWFHKFVSRAQAVCFIKGRLAFVPSNRAELYAKGLYRPKANPGAGSMLVAYGIENAQAVMACGLGLSFKTY